MGIADRVHWLRRPRREELSGLMGASTLLAVPARDDLVLGRQIPRAMASFFEIWGLEGRDGPLHFALGEEHVISRLPQPRRSLTGLRVRGIARGARLLDERVRDHERLAGEPLFARDQWSGLRERVNVG